MEKNMLVGIYKEIENGRPYEEYLDTDDLSDEDYVEFRKLWDSGSVNDRIKAREYLMEHI